MPALCSAKSQPGSLVVDIELWEPAKATRSRVRSQSSAEPLHCRSVAEATRVRATRGGDQRRRW